MNQELRIMEEGAGKRLDVFLHEHLPDYSRSRIQKLIKDGFVTVNGKVFAPHHFLKEGDVIEKRSQVEKWGQAQIPSEIEPDPISPPRIIAETDEYIVIDKPAGMVVHPGIRHEQGTVADFLRERYPDIAKVGNDPLRPGIVHRLDKDASGVMVVARTEGSFESLVRQFKLRQVKKEYYILVYGRVTPSEGVIDLPIGRSKQQYTKRAAHPLSVIPSPPASERGIPSRNAVTRYVVLEQFKHASLLRVTPETGRTHQIRVHFFSKGNPIVGDMIYFSKKIKPIPAPRLMLHAERLGFRDSAGQWQEYTVAPDEDFQNALKQIKNS